ALSARPVQHGLELADALLVLSAEFRPPDAFLAGDSSQAVHEIRQVGLAVLAARYQELCLLRVLLEFRSLGARRGNCFFDILPHLRIDELLELVPARLILLEPLFLATRIE